MTKRPKNSKEAEYQVGYGKPPKSGRFKKGQSGNPAGRPRKSKNKEPTLVDMLQSIVLEEGYREVTIQGKDGPTSIPVVQAALRSQGLKAAQGNVQAQKQFIAAVERVAAEEYRKRSEAFFNAVKYKEDKLAEIEEYRKHNKKPPLMLPHPDHMELVYETQEVIFHGPCSRDDLIDWNRLHGTINQLGEEIRRQQSELVELDDDDDHVDWIKEQIKEHQFIVMTASLSIARRWQLPIQKVLNPYVSIIELKKHLDNGTDPTPPKAYKKLAAQTRNRR